MRFLDEILAGIYLVGMRVWAEPEMFLFGLGVGVVLTILALSFI